MFIYNIIAKHIVDYQRACHFFIFYNFGTENPMLESLALSGNYKISKWPTQNGTNGQYDYLIQ